MKNVILIPSLFLLSSCSSFESHGREMQNKNMKKILAEHRLLMQELKQKFFEKCTNLGLKIGTTEHNVCVDRKMDNANLTIGIANGMYQIDRSSKARDLQIKNNQMWKNHSTTAGQITKHAQ